MFIEMVGEVTGTCHQRLTNLMRCSLFLDSHTCGFRGFYLPKSALTKKIIYERPENYFDMLRKLILLFYDSPRLAGIITLTRMCYMMPNS